ncbi:MAG: NAD(P)/FAD-dependent oxidoreductase [Pseudomonadota bacterium]
MGSTVAEPERIPRAAGPSGLRGITDETPRIVIIGGGIGGLMLATRLGRSFRATKLGRVYLIDKSPVHVWKPMLHAFAAGTLNAREDGIPFAAQAKRGNFVYLPGELFHLDPEKKLISIRITDLQDKPDLETKIPYDLAVISVGNKANDFGIRGVHKHCHFIDSLPTAEALNQSLREEVIYRSIAGGEIEVAIIGGGATGVEFAAETARMVDIGAQYGLDSLPKKLRITMIETGATILNAFPTNIARDVTKKLEDLGVSIKTGVRVTNIDKTGIELDNGERIEAATKVWAAGTSNPDLLSGLDGIDLTRSGQVVVTPTLQTPSFETIFAIGDCASLTQRSDDEPLPPTGQVARQQADYLATAIPRFLKKQDLQPFKYRDRGSLVSLSQYGAYGTLAGKGPVPTIALRGWLAMKAHDVFYRVHQFGLYGLFGGFIVISRDWLNSLIKPPIGLN